MATAKQELGTRGEDFVTKVARCPGCKRIDRTFKVLPPNFKCADIVCDFCGYLAQVKSKSWSGIFPDECPTPILGAAWQPQRERMDAGIYFSLYVVLEHPSGNRALYFLPRDLQTEAMFVPRTPLSPGAKRAGWQGFMIEIDKALAGAVRLA